MNKQSGRIYLDAYAVTYCALTDIGMVRSHNEDAFLVLEEARVFCIADGAGGHQMGELASALTLKGIKDIIAGNDNLFFDDTLPLDNKTVPIIEPVDSATGSILIPAIHHANELCRNSGEKDLASTIVSCQFHNNLIHVAHVGDSRAYSFQNGTLTQLTEDHSLVNYLFKQGEITEEEKETHPRRNVILQAIGIEDKVRISHNFFPVTPGTSYLLCSDGLSSMLSNQKIAELMKGATDSVETLCESLLQAANNAGGRDNITILILKVSS